MNDLVRRADVLMLFCNKICGKGASCLDLQDCEWLDEVYDLPKPEEGSWIKYPLCGIVCSQCGMSNNKRTEYCPNCGSKMKKEEER